MLVCPHCNKEIEVKKPEPDFSALLGKKRKVPWWLYPLWPRLSWSERTLVAIFCLVFYTFWRLSQKVDDLTYLVKLIQISISGAP